MTDVLDISVEIALISVEHAFYVVGDTDHAFLSRTVWWEPSTIMFNVV